MIDFSKPLETRGGHPVTIISTEGRGVFPIVGYAGANSTELYTWRRDGGFSSGPNIMDLRNTPSKPLVVPLKGFLTVYDTPGRTGTHFGRIYPTREAALEGAGSVHRTLIGVFEVDTTFTAETLNYA